MGGGGGVKPTRSTTILGVIAKCTLTHAFTHNHVFTHVHAAKCSYTHACIHLNCYILIENHLKSMRFL